MVYKLTEHNQILIALFAIVVLCAGKLFKDYLFRGGYIEGMSVSVETDKQFRRNANVTGAVNVIGEVTFKVTLEKGLLQGGTITLSWTGSTAASAADVTTSVIADHYTATPSFSAASLSNNDTTATFTANSAITAGSMVTIKVKNITIYPGDKASTLKFTITSSNTTEGSLSRDVNILPAISGTSSNQYTNPTATTATDIKNALDAIQLRIDATGEGAPSVEDKREYIKMRTALTALMASTYGTIKEAGQVFESKALYEAQRTAIDFIKKEKARAESNATSLKQDNLNKRRMAQVNTYYTKNYEANTDVMKNIIIVSVALIILAVLRNKSLIPESIGTLGVIFILTLGGIVIGKQVYDILRRNDHDFDKYDWTFNEDELNKKNLLSQNSDSANLSDMGMGMAACYGPGCCADGTTWNSEMGKCLPNVGRVLDGKAVFSGNILTITFKAPSGLVIASSGPPAVAADTVTIKLPSAADGTSLFNQNGTPSLEASGATSFLGTPLVKGEFTLTKTSSAIAGTDTVTIKINNLAVNAAKASEISKILTVKTSKDTNLVGIKITGI